VKCRFWHDSSGAIHDDKDTWQSGNQGDSRQNRDQEVDKVDELLSHEKVTVGEKTSEKMIADDFTKLKLSTDSKPIEFGDDKRESGECTDLQTF